MGAPLVDASGFSHPGLIPIGIPMLCASQEQLSTLRGLALANQCDVVDFPVEGQQTKNYAEFMDMTAAIATDELHYTGIALIGPEANKRLVKGLALILDRINPHEIIWTEIV